MLNRVVLLCEEKRAIIITVYLCFRLFCFVSHSVWCYSVLVCIGDRMMLTILSNLPSFAVCCDVLCFATAANATGAVVGIMLFCIGGWSRVEMGFAWEWFSSRAEDDWFWSVEPPPLLVIIDDVALVIEAVDATVDAPDTFSCVELAVAGEALCDWFLLGVEHTVLLGADTVLFIVEFRSDLLARTAVGLTG